MTELPMAERCETCRFWKEMTMPPRAIRSGECCRRCPWPWMKDMMNNFPTTGFDAWCGEYEPQAVAPSS